MDKQGLSILVICMYAEQLTVLKREVAAKVNELQGKGFTGALILLTAEVRTVDASQGHEADVVLVSFVRANKSVAVGMSKDCSGEYIHLVC